MHRLRCRFDGSIAASLCFFCCRFALCQALACRQMASYLVNRGVHGGLSNCQVTTSAAVMVKYRQRFCWKWKMSSTLSFPVFAGVERSSMHMHTYTTLLFCLRQHTISTVAGEYGSCFGICCSSGAYYPWRQHMETEWCGQQWSSVVQRHWTQHVWFQ